MAVANFKIMRIRILSDLHHEFGATDIPVLEADAILFAGDVDTKQNALPWIEEFQTSWRIGAAGIHPQSKRHRKTFCYPHPA
jgi:hypothetical protein